MVLEIPQFGTKHSLNISVSVGVVIWDVFSKLKVKSLLFYHSYKGRNLHFVIINIGFRIKCGMTRTAPNIHSTSQQVFGLWFGMCLVN